MLPSPIVPRRLIAAGVGCRPRGAGVSTQNGFAGGGEQDLPDRQPDTARKNPKDSAKDAAASASFVLLSGQGTASQIGPATEARAATGETPKLDQDDAGKRLERLGELLNTEAMIMRQVKPASLTAGVPPAAPIS